ncbi:hypothetical protein [Salinimicrobium gaetbulicola]|uniref:Adhesin n=1 Tax=Salinimicrobium gaetbulicola TaxID=999702 RepID=A0ABW3IB16_9FLAO
MKAQLYNILIALLLVPAISCASNEYKGKYTKEKKIKKEYTVSANDLLSLDNSYGNIDVETWEQNRVEIQVIIKTNGNDEEKVKERLDDIDVIFNQNSDGVTAKTIFEKSNSSWISALFGSSSNVNMEINYIVKAPVTNNMNISNDYGSINLDKLEGDLKLSCDYGKFLIGELNGKNNYLNFDYTRNSSIDVVKRAKIRADYSEFTIDNAGSIDLAADYTDARFRKVVNLKYNNDYGSLKVDKVKNISGSGDYLGIDLGMLYSTADINMDYGSLSIDRIMGSMKKVNIKSDYTSIKLGYDRESPFSFDVNTSYGSVKGLDGNGFTVNKRNQSGSDNYFEGFHINGNTGGTITINSSYGGVRFQ